MTDPGVWVAAGMALVGAIFPIVGLFYLAWRDRKRQNVGSFDEST